MFNIGFSLTRLSGRLLVLSTGGSIKGSLRGLTGTTVSTGIDESNDFIDGNGES